ncbi:LuxR family transcriptional regulator [Kitasatospora sp. LaBMicrA B282]|uniref:LuxR family transcriptional regulator n=1 Tax=Kitasatospora sp. LaBMicrA B282 TaxID=3420949 RepID=UPI003D0C086C
MYSQLPSAPIPSSKARETYVELLRRSCRQGDGTADRPTGPEESQQPQAAPPVDHETLQELLFMGMVDPDASCPEQVVAVDPGIVEARLGALLRSSALSMLEEARSLTDLLRPLMADARRATGPVGSELFTRIEGKAAISAIVNETVQQCSRQLLTAQPGGGRPAGTLDAVRRQTTVLLERGVEVRTLYQHTAWHDGPTRDYVSEMTGLGGEYRTLDQFFDRLIVVDHRIAFIPADTDRSHAVVIREPAVVRFLADVFERNWQRAKPFYGSRTPNESSHISAELRETIIRCLIDGDSDSAIARRIGLSTRAYSTHLARLKAEFKVETRFQLGYQLGLLEAAGKPEGE